ncbi:hypothetical protein Plhal304r1_c014g0052791 [Plasmopara halstedii]
MRADKQEISSVSSDGRFGNLIKIENCFWQDCPDALFTSKLVLEIEGSAIFQSVLSQAKLFGQYP